MSYVFDIDDETVWSPASRIGALYIAQLHATAEVLQAPSGLRAVASDFFDIDVRAFQPLTQNMLTESAQSRHPVLHLLLDGVLAPSLIMLERAGKPLQQLSEAEQATQQRLLGMRLPMPQ